jgi:KDO2-lipid IV(A) lauroyltransferase
MTRLAIAFLWLLHTLLPHAALAWLGERLGGLLFWLARARRHIGETNLRLCFPDLDPAARRAMLKAHFRATGRASLLETVSWWGSREALERLVRVEGEDILRAHLGKPLILLAPHFIGLNLGGVRMASLHGECVSMYAHIKNPTFDRLMLHSRTRFGDQQLVSRKDGIKPILRAIKQGRPFYYLPDLDFGAKDAIFVPFFGVPAATITGLSRIARATGAAVVPLITRWQDDGYVLRFYPAWEGFPSEDVAADTRRMNAFIEDQVREMPEQYFWLHMRFKTRPKGEGKKRSLYGRG